MLTKQVKANDCLLEEININLLKDITFDLFLKFKEICETNNLTYWVAFGTLLGTVRHKDFIPWDDDLDIMMPRNDYEKLLEIMKKDNSSLSILNWKETPNYPYCIGRFNDSNYIVDEDARFNYGLGLCIDIYPLDGVNIKNKAHMKTLIFRRFYINQALHKQYKKSKSWFKNIFKYLFFWFAHHSNIKTIIKKTEKIAKKYSFDESEYVGDIVWDPKYIFKKEWFDDTCYLEFHGIEVPVPIGYKEVLKTRYGNYMELPPIEKRVPYHFEKIYKKQ